MVKSSQNRSSITLAVVLGVGVFVALPARAQTFKVLHAFQERKGGLASALGGLAASVTSRRDLEHEAVAVSAPGCGIFLLLAARNPSANRSLIAFTAWSSFAHAVLMAGQALANLIARGELIGSAVLVVIGVALVTLAPSKQPDQRASGALFCVQTTSCVADTACVSRSVVGPLVASVSASTFLCSASEDRLCRRRLRSM